MNINIIVNFIESLISISLPIVYLYFIILFKSALANYKFLVVIIIFLWIQSGLVQTFYWYRFNPDSASHIGYEIFMGIYTAEITLIGVYIFIKIFTGLVFTTCGQFKYRPRNKP